MKAIINDITVDLGSVINILLHKPTPCAYCKKDIQSRKHPLFLNNFGVLHDSCYKYLVKECAEVAKA